MEILQSHGFILVAFTAFVGFVMAWGIGANDVANAMGTSVGSKAITIKQAIIIAAVFEFSGAYLAGGEVTETIRKGIIDSSYFADVPEYLVFGMISSLMAAGTWLIIASYYGWPVSTTHSIIGAIVGFSAVGVSVDAVSWGAIGGIVGSWVLTPAISGIFALGIFMSAQKLIFDTDDPLKYAKRYVPIYMGFAGFVIGMVTILKGLKHVFDTKIAAGDAVFFSCSFAVLVMIVGTYFIRRLKFDPDADKEMRFKNVESIFAVLMVCTACCMAFAHGSNDVANAIGPIAAVVNVIDHGGEITAKSELVWWVLPLGGIGIVCGLALFGARVMATIGEGITHLTPSRGFAAEMAAATTVVLASGTGLPISTTQTLVGAVLGVGIARGIAALNLGVIRNIIVSWVVTLPAGAVLSVIFFYIIKAIFGA